MLLAQRYGRTLTPENPMRFAIAAFAACTLAATICGAAAQTAPNGPQNPAVKGVHDNNSSTPVAGANSFTMAEAKSQIEAKGYTHVTGLKKAKDGVWHGKASKDGKSGAVSVDYQGNVN
jgi:hypothetical protein